MFYFHTGQYIVVQAYAGGSMEVKLSVVDAKNTDDLDNLIAARLKISGG